MYNNSFIVVGTWPNTGPVAENWGDKLNKYLINRLSGSPAAHVSDVLGWGNRPVHMCIGSALAYMASNNVVWGMGFLDRNTAPKAVAAQICAVRGPISREILGTYGIGCPEIYGDPAILCPMIYRPKVEIQFEYGIIQHYREANVTGLAKIKDTSPAKTIDICGSVEGVINEILSCKTIISSSLHGVICAHAYGRSAYWLKASDLPLGDDVKFHDYFASIGHPNMEPAVIDEDGYFSPRNSPSRPVPGFLDSDALLKACPFLDQHRLLYLLAQKKNLSTQGFKGTIFGS